MNETYKIISLDDLKEWKKYLSRLPIEQRDVYYTPEYYSVAENNGDGKAYCFVFEDKGELAIYPFLLNSINKIGYDLDKEYFDIQGAYGYNGVLSSSYVASFINLFYDAFNDFCYKWNIIAEFVRFHPLLNNQKFSENFIDQIEDRETIVLNIDQPYQDIWKNEYSSKNRNMVRKSEKAGCKSYVSNNDKDWIEFMDLYKQTMQNVGASDYYFFDNKYFNDLKEKIESNTLLIVNKLEGIITGGMILFAYGNYAHYHLSARDTKYGKFAVNNNFLNKAIEIACNMQSKKMHFGGGASSSPDDPLLKFKSNFSKERGAFFIGKKIHQLAIYDLIIKQWQAKYPHLVDANKNILLKYRIQS